jgi:hypothetical protein
MKNKLREWWIKGNAVVSPFCSDPIHVIEYSAYESAIEELEAQRLCTISSENALAKAIKERDEAKADLSDANVQQRQTSDLLSAEREKSAKLVEAIMELKSWAKGASMFAGPIAKVCSFIECYPVKAHSKSEQRRLEAQHLPERYTIDAAGEPIPDDKHPFKGSKD